MNDAKAWNDRYLARDTGWDKGRCSPPIARMIREGLVPASATVGVVGAGRGHEAFEAARSFSRVIAIDFAPEAVAAMQEAMTKGAPRIETLQADVLTLHQTHPAAFDAIIEHTCYCAIDPSQRDAYVASVRGALKPGGLLFGLFYNHGRPGGPPFDTSEADVRERFRGFRFERFVKAADSFDARTNQEWEAVLRREG